MASQIPVGVIAGALATIMAGLLITSLRHRAVMRALGLDMPFAVAFKANVFGILGGLLFFQALGQTLARTAVLARHGVGGAAVVLANMCERAVALLSLLMLSTLAVLYLYGQISFDAAGSGGPLIKIALGLALVCTAVLAIVPEARQGLRALLSTGWLGSSCVLLGHSLLVHAATLSAFVTLGRTVAPDVTMGALVAASVVVMLAASLPISFAGWGVRELSAVQAYSLIGISPDKALAIAVIVGLVSLVSVLLLACMASLMRNPQPAEVASKAVLVETRQWSANLGATLALWLPVFVAMLVYFQLQVPTLAGTMVNLNLADPIALLGGVVFISLYRHSSNGAEIWRSRHMPLYLGLATSVLVLGFALGCARLGFIEWAFFNRLLGWLVLLAYLGTGALALATGGEARRASMFKVLIVSGVAIAGLEIVLTTLALMNAKVGSLLPHGGIMGLSQNTNAFALQLVLLFAFMLVGGVEMRTDSVRGRMVTAVLAMLIVAIYLTRSRMGYVTGSILLLAALALRWTDWRVAVRGLILATFVLVVLLWLPHLWAETIAGGNATVLTDSGRLMPRLIDAGSDGERWSSIVRGLALWREFPLFGAGLGAFITLAKAETGKALVIHNSAVWLLAELGLFGCGVFLVGLVGMARAAWHNAHEDPTARLLLLSLLACAIFQLAHDILYQRMIWLMLGATLAVVPLRQTSPTSHDRTLWMVARLRAALSRPPPAPKPVTTAAARGPRS